MFQDGFWEKFSFLQTTWFTLKADCYHPAWQHQAGNSLSSIINLYRLILRFQEKKQQTFNNANKDSNKCQEG